MGVLQVFERHRMVMRGLCKRVSSPQGRGGVTAVGSTYLARAHLRNHSGRKGYWRGKENGLGAPSATKLPAVFLAGVEDVDDELVKMYNTKALRQATRRIQACAKERKPNLAIRTLADLANQGIQPDRIAATAVIDACVQSSKMDLAENVFNELFGQDDFMEPDEVTYAVLIKGYGQDIANPKWSKIRQILQVMEAAGLDLTTCTYNTLLEICAGSNDWQRGMQVLEQMADRQVLPDQKTLEIVKKRKTLR